MSPLTVGIHQQNDVSKTRVISFTRKTNMIPFEHTIFGSRINSTNTVKNLEIILDIKVYFYHHVDYIFSQYIKLLDLICAKTFSFSSVDSLLTLYFTLVRSKLENASVAWNYLTSTDASRLESAQRKFLALCYNRFCPQIHYTYANALEHLNFHTLCSRRRHLDAPFLVNVYNENKFCPSLFETVGIRDRFRIFRVFPLLVPHIKVVPLLDVH
jgi:hypothetical protein